MAGSLASGGTLGPAQKKQAQAFKDRIVSLLDERDGVNENIKEVFDEAREAGFDTKIMRKAIKRIRTDLETLKAEEEMIDSYVEAMQPDLFAKKAA